MSIKRDAILRASATAIAEHGVRGLRVLDVAEAAAVSPGLLYYHFKDRDGLLAAALTYINDTARAYRSTSCDPSATARERLIDQVLNEIQDQPNVVEASLVWNELRASAVYELPLREPLAATTEQWSREYRELIEQARAEGEVPDHVDASTVAAVITALTEGLSARWLCKEISGPDARAQLRSAIEAMLPAVDSRKSVTLNRFA